MNFLYYNCVTIPADFVQNMALRTCLRRTHTNPKWCLWVDIVEILRSIDRRIALPLFILQDYSTTALSPFWRKSDLLCRQINASELSCVLYGKSCQEHDSLCPSCSRLLNSWYDHKPSSRAQIGRFLFTGPYYCCAQQYSSIS